MKILVKEIEYDYKFFFHEVCIVKNSSKFFKEEESRLNEILRRFF